jgi:hypothetical protein
MAVGAKSFLKVSAWRRRRVKAPESLSQVNSKEEAYRGYDRFAGVSSQSAGILS